MAAVVAPVLQFIIEQAIMIHGIGDQVITPLIIDRLRAIAHLSRNTQLNGRRELGLRELDRQNLGHRLPGRRHRDHLRGRHQDRCPGRCREHDN